MVDEVAISETLLETTDDPVVIVGGDGQIHRANEAARTLGLDEGTVAESPAASLDGFSALADCPGCGDVDGRELSIDARAGDERRR